MNIVKKKAVLLRQIRSLTPSDSIFMVFMVEWNCTQPFTSTISQQYAWSVSYMLNYDRMLVNTYRINGKHKNRCLLTLDERSHLLCLCHNIYKYLCSFMYIIAVISVWKSIWQTCYVSIQQIYGHNPHMFSL